MSKILYTIGGIILSILLVLIILPLIIIYGIGKMISDIFNKRKHSKVLKGEIIWVKLWK